MSKSSSPVRVLQAVAYVSSDGAYGGPVTVARHQVEGLRSAGLAVTFVAGWDGRAEAPLLGAVLFRTRKLVRRSFASLVSPGLLAWTARHVRRHDVVHVHFARDLITVPFALLALAARRPLVLQPHGMVQPDPRAIVRAIDLLVTGPILRRAAVVIALTKREAEGLIRLGVDRARIQIIGNGVPFADEVAHVADSGPRVVFASRLAPRKRPVAFVHMAALVQKARPDVRFEMWGPDGGVLREVNRTIENLGLSGVCRYRGAAPNEQIRRILSEAQVFVLPSLNEPFPMALLEAMSAGLPSVITHDTGVSDLARDAGASIVTDGSPEQLADAVTSLLADAAAWTRSARASKALVDARFSMDSVVRSLIAAYDGPLEGETRSSPARGPLPRET